MTFDVLFALQSAPGSPVIVKLIEPPDTRLRDIVLGAVGLSGALAIGALIVGLMMAGLVFWVRSKRNDERVKLNLWKL